MRHSYRILGILACFTALPACGGGGGGGGSPAAPLPTWTVMVYMSADNNLEDFAPFNINQMEAAASSPNLNVIVEVDTKTIPIKGSATAKRLRIQPDANPLTVTSPTLSDLGEIDTAAASELTNFVTYATGAFPADRYVLILWNHGGQYEGFASDDTACACSGGPPINYSNLKTAFTNIEIATGIASFDIIGWDACLMGALETQRLLRDRATLIIASAELEPGQGWNYTPILNAIAANPAATPLSIAQTAADAYIAQCTSFKPNNDATLSVFQTSNTNTVVSALDLFAVELQAALPTFGNTIAFARRTATEYGRGNPEEPAEYIDIREFSAIISLYSVGALQARALALVNAIDSSVLYRVQGSLSQFHRGASIYFPDCAFCYDVTYGTTVDLALESRWDNFIAGYVSAVGGDTTPPSITITGASSAFVSQAAPVTISYSVSGADLYQVTAEVILPQSPTQWLILAEVDLNVTTTGNHAVTWDSRLFQLNDGVRANFLAATIADPAFDLYTCYVEHTPSGGGPSQTLIMYVVLNYATEAGFLVGFYKFQPSGLVSGISVKQNDLINIWIPSYNPSTGAFSYVPSVDNLIVPAGGLGIASFGIAPGNYDFDLFAEDYAGNIEAAAVALTVP